MMLPLTVRAEPALTQRWLLLPHAVEAGLDFSGTDFDDGGWKPVSFPNTEWESCLTGDKVTGWYRCHCYPPRNS